MRYGDRGHPHVATDDDDARVFVDDDAGRLIGLDHQLFDVGEQVDDIAVEIVGQGDPYIGRIGGDGDGQADKIVDGQRDAARGGEIGVAQREAHRVLGAEREIDLALDQGARGDHAGGGHARNHCRGLALGRKTVDEHRALGNGIGLAIGAKQGRDQKRAALERGRIAHGRDRNVEARALCGKGRQIGGDHHGGNICRAHRLAAGVDPHALEHGDHRLAGEGRIVEAVAGAVEAHDQPVADQLVVAHALDLDDILDAGRCGKHRKRPGDRQCGGESDCQCGAKQTCFHFRPIPRFRAACPRPHDGVPLFTGNRAKSVPSTVASC